MAGGFDPEQRASDPLADRVEVIREMTHLAYDAPKKASASQVIAAARAVLSEARKLFQIHMKKDIYIQTRKSQIQDVPNEGQTNRI